MKKIIMFFVVVMVAFAGPAFAKHEFLEKEYQAAWCNQEQGEAEHVLDDGARVDCLTDKYAVEVDFGPKWAESIGQSLYYGIKTEKKPGVLLIIEKPTDARYLFRLWTVAKMLDIKVWTITPECVRAANGN